MTVMKAMFTSFGIGDEALRISGLPTPQFERIDRSYLPSPFYKLPPVDMDRTRQGFLPDFSLILLCDKIILDTDAYAVLSDRPHEAYRAISETVRILMQKVFSN
jgi:hypothetical protein